MCAALSTARAQNEPSPDLDDEVKTESIARGDKGIKYASADERTSIHLWLRTQFRYSTPFESDPRRAADFDDTPGGDFELNRARLKAKGTILGPRVGYYYEHELAGDPRLLDLRFDLTQREDFRLRIGQYKVLYNRERVDSSGAQQFVERSIVTRTFTLDRQRGITAAGRIGENRAYDAWYFLGLMEGDGRDPGASGGKGDGKMWIGRYQWNFAGEPLPFSQSDFEFRAAPSGTLAIAAARFKGPYTRFSSEGGGQLDGFADGIGNQYAVRQWMQEFAWQYGGWSVQQEYHVKRIEDQLNGGSTRLNGYYARLDEARGSRVAVRESRPEREPARRHTTRDDARFQPLPRGPRQQAHVRHQRASTQRGKWRRPARHALAPAVGRELLTAVVAVRPRLSRDEPAQRQYSYCRNPAARDSHDNARGVRT